MPGLYDLVPASRPIDYDRMNRELPKVKGALTRAKNAGDPYAVLVAVERFLELSREVGAMPDNWPLWRNALEDAWREFQRTTLDEYGEDVFDGSGEASPVLRFQRAAVRF
jgi:hypothetical protein